MTTLEFADARLNLDVVDSQELARLLAGGSGVISGLMVDDVDSVGGTTLRIEPGHGVTPNGDLVMLTSTRDVPVMDLPTTRQLDAAMGLSADPRVPLVSQSGLFVLGLRAVEFTANPIAAYPRSITGQRTVEDGDIIEATAITLVPFPDISGAATATEARRAVARYVFVCASEGVRQSILVMAVMALGRGTVQWI